MSRMHESSSSLIHLDYETRQVRGIPVARASAHRLPHVWVENVTKRVKTEVSEFHLYKKTSVSLNKQFDRNFPEIYKYRRGKEPNRINLEYVSAEDRVVNRLNFVDDGMGRALKAPKMISEDGLGNVVKKRRRKKKKLRIEGPTVPPQKIDKMMGLESFDFLKDKERAKFSNTGSRGAKFYADINQVESRRRKKNRHLPRIRNKKERQKLTADVVALESALALISRYGDKYRGGEG
ncbi:hypothetical protein TrVE_jg489 [Triparma verrucosa]|uniref:Uncharacterized protein n=2 Tax=Triparma TaxID=722752 RepID=A0A9W7B0W5_9STRA|nr:hypothetical protein TrST_g12565 [Triparma strigata]GMH93447.1 hypothetical protein TrVE_jg489 [Triparma verrucosa]